MIHGIYFVTDAYAPITVTAQVDAALTAGIRIIQLRDKTMTDAEMVRVARMIQPMVCSAWGRLVINDRVDVAIACKVDGLHIGQSDGDVMDVRERIGPDMILGLSIENHGQLAAMPPNTVDYIGAGPVRATGSKPNHAPPLGFEGLAQITAAAPCPTVAIGGLTVKDTAAVHAAGCVSMAVVAAIAHAPNAALAASDLVTGWEAST